MTGSKGIRGEPGARGEPGIIGPPGVPGNIGAPVCFFFANKNINKIFVQYQFNFII